MGHSYKDLVVWQKAKTLAVQVYELTDTFPRKEVYGLSSQLRRAAVSVASNIAEGQGRLTTGEFLHFLGQSRGSLLELQTQLAISLELRYISKQQLEAIEKKSSEVLRLLNALIESLRNKASAASAGA
jgi:four helix bundle protein